MTDPAVATTAYPHRRRTGPLPVGVLAKIGVNSRGLGVHFNILEHVSDTDTIGVPVHLIARRILDEAGTLAEARHIAVSARTSASTVITVVSFHEQQADAVCLELSPVGVHELRPAQDGTLLHTNHFLDPELARGQRQTESLDDSHNRLAVLRSRSQLFQDADLAKRAGALLSHAEDGAALCVHPDPDDTILNRWETLITISLDLEAKRLIFAEDGPCRLPSSGWQYF